MTDFVVSDQPLEDFGGTSTPATGFTSVDALQKGRARMWTDQERAAMQAEDTSPDEIQRLREAIAAAPHPQAKAALEEQLARALRQPAAPPGQSAAPPATIQPASYVVADQPLDFAPAKASSGFITPQAEATPKGKEPGEFRKGFVGSLIDQQPNLAGGFLEAIGATTDAQGFKDAGAKLRKFGSQNADKRAARVPSVENIRFSGTPGDIAQDISDYAAFQLGSGLGSTAPSLGAGLATTLITANPVIGIAAGAFGPSYVQNAGDVWVSSMSDPDIKAKLEAGGITEKQIGKMALMAGVPMAALDVVGLEGALGHLMKPAKQALVKKIITGMATGAIAEGSTEGLQQVISQWAQDNLGANKPAHDKFIEIVDNVLAGALAGGATGGVAAPFHKGKAAPAQPAQDEQQYEVGDVPLEEVRPEDQPFTRRGVMTTDDAGAAALTDNPTPAAAEPIDIVPGAPTTFSTERGSKLDGQFAVVDASQLVTSHTENLDQNAAYPQELQPRDRSRAASEIQVARISNNIQPDFLGESPMASQGAPIIGEDGVVESGNARSIALARAYKNGKAEPYRQWVLANAAKFGLDPAVVETKANPVLVRVRRTPVNRVEFSRQANESSIAQMSPVEQARADADRIGNLDDFKVDEDGDLNAAENRGFIRRFVGGLPTTEQGAMVDADGMLSQSGMARVRNAILAKAYGESGPLMRIVESLDDNTRNISRSLTRVAPMVAKVREAIRAGALHDRDITQDVIRAVEEFSKLRSKKMTVGQMLAQTSFFGNGLSPETLTLLQFLEDNSRSPARISAFIEAYLSALEGIGNPAQAGLFGANVVPSKEELLDAARQRTGTDEAGAGLPAGKSTPAKPAAERTSEPGGERAGGVSRPAESGEKGGERSGDAKRTEAKPAERAEPAKPEKGEVTPDAIKKELRAAKEKKKKAAAPKPATPAPGHSTEDSAAQSALTKEPSGAQVAAGPDLSGLNARRVLPPELAGAKPRYNYADKAFTLKFDADIDRAAYITAQENPSARDADYLKWAMQATSKPAKAIRDHGARVRAAIKAMAKNAEPGELVVPEMWGVAESPAPEPAAQDPESKARADLDAALGEIGAIFRKGGGVKNITPEEEAQLLPALTKLFDAAFRLGYHKFKKAARFAVDQIRAHLGDEIADHINLDHLQGAYIGMSGRYRDKGADSKKDVVAIESMKEITEDAPAAASPPEALQKPEPAAPAEAAADSGEQVALPFLTEDEAKKEFDKFHHLFDKPDDKDKVRTADAVKVYNAKHGWMSLAEARKKIAEWKAHAAAQGEGDNANGDKVVLSLFDLTGTWSQPWEDAGYDVYRFDIQEGAHYQEDINNFSVEYFNDMFGSFDGKDVHAILAACPCTDFAVSGARHFAAKDADGRTADSIKLVHQTLAVIEYFKPSIWAIENPVSRIEELGGLPPWRMSFDPNHFGEAYTKKTILWGRFNPTLPIAPVEPTEGSKMHSQYGGKSQRTKNARSATPVGFAYSFFMANNAIDNPTLAISGKYDRLDENLIDRAVKAGITAEQIDEAVEELYYQELDDKGANAAVRALIPAPAQIKGELQAAKKKKKKAAAVADDAVMPVMEAPPTRTDPNSLYITRDGEIFPVASIEDAVDKWNAYRDQLLYDGAGGSEIGNGVEIHGPTGKMVARVSYNGRVWNPDGSEYKGKEVAATVDEGAHAAATSPHNDLPEPTLPQIKAGNYQKGHFKLDGLDISIENPAGSERSGVDANGKKWSVTMQDHYGYIRGTVGKDKDHIDVFVKVGTPEGEYGGEVYVIDQKKKGNGHFDEHKVMIGWGSFKDAEEAYLANYTKGWDGLEGISLTSMDQFKRWLAEGDTKKRFAEWRDDMRAARSKAGYDFKDSFPWPTNPRYFRDLLDETPFGEENESFRIIHEEQTAELGTYLRDEAAIREALRTGVDPANGKAPRTPSGKAKLKERLEKELVAAVRNFDEGMDAYAEAFGDVAAGSFRNAVLDAHRNLDPNEGSILAEDGTHAGTQGVDGGNGQVDLFAESGRAADSGPVGTGLAEGNESTGGEGATSAGAEGTGDAGGDGAGGREAGRGKLAPGGSRTDGSLWDSPQPARVAPANYTITDADRIGEGGAKTKYRDNIAAIRLAQRLTDAGANATPEEQAVLARYVGWGGLKNVFDAESKDWAKEYAELKGLLPEDQYERARRTILDAHYTSVPIIRGIHAALSRMGFKGGRVLEPSVGIGNFFGLMPKSARAESALFGIELDPITGQIASLLYPKAKIVSPKGFEDVSVPPGYFDVAIGNPPFGNQSVYDSEHPDISKFSIHNFFFAKSLESLRPGGIMGMVVSRYFLDQQDAAAREWIARRADLIGAARLPYTAFKENANTEVVTDVVFFQKRETPLADGEPMPEWTKTGMVTLTDEKGNAVEVRRNAHYNDMNGAILGEESLTGSMYRENEYTVAPKKDWYSLDDFVDTLPEDIYKPPVKRVEELADVDGLVPAEAKVGAFFVMPDGSIGRRLPDQLAQRRYGKIELASEMGRARIKGMVKVRDALRALMRAELSDQSDAQIGTLREKLNTVYDEFVRKYGFVNQLGNRRAFQEDPDLPLLESLEPNFDPGTSKAVAKKNNVPVKEPSAGKASIFTKRVLAPIARITKVDTPKDALLASLNEKGKVDLEYMAQIAGVDQDTLTKQLAGLIYEDPAGGWVTSEQYLSGNVKAALAAAKAAAEKDARFAANVDALERVQPADIEPLDISVRLGAPWLSEDTIADFTQELLGVRPKVGFIRAVGRWSFQVRASGPANTATWGTQRVPADELIPAILNLKQIVVKDNVGTSKEPVYVVNEEETQAAQAKSEALQQKFKDWIWADEKRRDTLARKYNDIFNTNRRRTYDGSHLTLPGLSPALKLRPHQKDAIWRWLQDRTILLDHVVGAGKTFTIVGGVMEMRRMGIARKPTLVVPNYLVRQWRDEFYKAYPNANILACTEADFSKGNRERLFSRIATGDWDAVIVPHSSFKKVGMPPETESAITGEMAADLATAIEEMKRERGDRHVMRDMERIKARLDEKMKRLAETGKKDKAVHFGELGIDALAVDEAHLFKNLFYFSQMQGVSGLGNPTGSGRAFDMFVKVRYLQQLAGERAIVGFATGTPVSNSLVEMFTMQRYLQYQQLRDRGIHLLDPWAGVFGDVQQVYEVHPSGNGYRLATRFAKFVNLPELMTMYRSFADVVTMKDLKAQAAARGTRWPIPKRATGKAILNVAERSPSQVLFFGVPEFLRNENGEIQFEAKPSQYQAMSRDEWLSRQQLGGDALKNAWAVDKPKFGMVDVSQSRIGAPLKTMDTLEDAQGEIDRLVSTPRTAYNEGSILWKFENLKYLMKKSDGKINALSITNEARKAGLDYRLIDPNAADFEGSKINEGVANMIRIHGKWTADRGTQLVFCDLSIPASARAKLKKQIDDAATKEAADQVGAEEKDDVSDEDSSPAGEEEAGISVDQLLAIGAKHSVYDDIKAKLIEGGIPADEIAFIHDFDTADKKGKLFAMVRAGTKRFLIGSTEKMGAGMNVQERLVGMHHMDAPWRPSDLEQRNGRWERQGNVLYERDPDGFEVEEHRYATKQTYDTRMWQIIEHKANGVEQLRNADQSTARTIEDISGEAATAADMKAAASGNPLILDEIKLRNQVNKLEAEESVFLRGRFAMERRLTYLRDAPNRARADREAFKPWVDRAAEHPPFEADKFAIEIGGKAFTDKGAIGGPLIAEVGTALKSLVTDAKRVAGKYRGFQFAFVKMSEKTFIGSWSVDGQKWQAFTNYGQGDEFKPSGFVARLDNAIAGLRTELAGIASTEKHDLDEAKKIDEQLKAPFDKKDELDQARRQHLGVVQKLQSQGGGLELTPKMREELNAALEKRGVKKLSRADYTLSSMQAVDVRDIVRRLLAGHRNAPQVSVWQNWKVAPKEVRDFIRARQAEDNGAGAFIDGQIHLFADNISDEAHAVFTLVHELEHFGLAGLFGAELNPILTRIFEDHVDIQLRVAKLRQRDSVLSKLDAIEEALADKAGEMVRDGRRPVWWQKLAAAFKDWLRRYGLWSGKLTDNEVNYLLERALKYAKNPPPKDFSHVYGKSSLSTTDEGRLSRVAEAPAPADTERRVDAILSRRGGFTPLETLTRVPVQALRLDRLTSGLYDRLLRLIGGFIPEKVKAGFVSDYALPGAVIDRRDLMFAHMRTQLRGVENTLQRLSSLTRAESRVVYEWLNDRNADHLLKDLPDESRAVLMEVRSQIDKMGREAVRLGQLTEAAYNANKLAYVHRSYRKYDLQEGEQAKTARARAVRILGDQYKGRGITDAARMDKVGTPDFWEKQRKLGKADIGQVNREFIRLERRENRGEGVGVLPGMEETGQLGRVLEVRYWPADEAMPPYLQGWTNAGTWKARDVKGDRVVMWRDFTKEERERMGEIDEARYAIAKTFHQMIHDVEAGRYLEWLANTQSRVEPEGPVVEATESMAASFAPGTWVRVPDTTIPGTATKKYGKLAGLYLPGPIWNDVRQVVNWKFQPLGELYSDVMRMWKISKTALSPTVHANNIMANVVMADWHDITGAHLVNALHVLLTSKDPASKAILDRFEDSGGTQGMYALNELQRDQLAPLIEQLRKEVDAADTSTGIVKASAVLQLMLSGKLREAASAAAQTKAGAAGSKAVGAMIDFYQTEDTVFRLAAFMKSKSEGNTDLEAGKFARRSFLDYHINAPWIQALRQTAFPFISFTYRALPMLAETAARKPWKLMKLGLLIGAANALGYALSGGDEDKERKLLPDEKAGRIWGIVPKLIRMPWNDSHGQPVFLDIRRWIPAGDVVDVGQGHSAVPILPMAVPGGPLAVLAELLFNKSQFTGREITKGTDTGFADMLDGDFSLETYKKVADHLYKSFAPNFPGLPGSWSTSALVDAGGGRTDVFGREQSVVQAALSSVGVKVASYPQDVLLRNAMLDFKAADAEITRNMRALAREYARKGITREEFDRKMAAQIAKKKRLADDMREKVE